MPTKCTNTRKNNHNSSNLKTLNRLNVAVGVPQVLLPQTRSANLVFVQPKKHDISSHYALLHIHACCACSHVVYYV